MRTFTIGEIAERTGFTASSLRYYEGIGLVTPAARTEAGYRLYDEGTVARMAFIARAKHLGCTLEEITDLVSVWDGERCGPLQRRFHDLITTKVEATQRQLTELTAFARQLREAAAHLAGEASDGPCDEGCACLTEPSGTIAAVSLGPEPDRDPGEVPISCTLSAGGMRERVEEWQALLTHVAARTTAPDGTLRLELDDRAPLDELARLVAAEQRCCAFFAFAITVDIRGVALEVRAPVGAERMIEDLFGAATAPPAGPGRRRQAG